MTDDETRFSRRLSAIDTLLDVMTDSLPDNYVISVGKLMGDTLRVTLRIEGRKPSVVVHIPICPDVEWHAQRKSIADSVVEAFIELHDDWLWHIMDDFAIEEER